MKKIRNLRLLKGIENLDEISFRNSNIKKLDITNLNFNCVPDLTNIKLENELSLHDIKVKITNSKEDKDRLRKLKTIAEENKDVDSYLIFNSLELEAKETNKHLNKIYGEISSYGTSVSKPLKCLFWWDIIFVFNYFLILYSNNLQINLKYNSGSPVINNIERISKPGRRFYSSAQSIPKIQNGLGIAIISTPKGVMTDAEARKAKVGGEIICKVF